MLKKLREVRPWPLTDHPALLVREVRWAEQLVARVLAVSTVPARQAQALLREPCQELQKPQLESVLVTVQAQERGTPSQQLLLARPSLLEAAHEFAPAPWASLLSL